MSLSDSELFSRGVRTYLLVTSTYKGIFLHLVSTSGEQNVGSTIFKHVRLVLRVGKICSLRFDYN